MPVTPYTWQTDDFLTASRLNGELYRTLGAYFQANGTGFHAARPVYKSFYGTNNGFSTVSGTWIKMSGTAGKWLVEADTGGFIGCRMDPAEMGVISLSGLQNGGGGTANGLTNPAAGLGIVIVNQAYTADTVGGNIIGAGFGSNSGSTPTSLGTSQPTNTALPQGPWALDLIDMATSGGIAPFAISSSSAAQKNLTDQSDGSAHACRLTAFWASMYPADGTTVASLPTPTTGWTGSTPLTAAGFNGLGGIAATMNLLNMPPALRAFGLGSATSVPNATTTTCVYGSKTYDTYGAYNTSTHTYTVPLNGIYLVYNSFPGAWNAGTGYSGVSINGTTYYGPAVNSNATNYTAGAKVQVFSLNAGDTILPITFQTSGGTSAGWTGGNGVFIVLYLGLQGAPGTLPSVPDITHSFMAGTPGSSMPSLLNSYLANDLLYLTQRPYFLGYQNTAQTGIAMATTTALTIDTVGGIVHSDAGDTYSGWNSGSDLYAAPRAGWYLAVQETQMAQPSLTATPASIAGFQVSPGGATNADWYQQNNTYPSGGGGGAAAVGVYYLRAGDTIKPVLYTQNSSSTTTGTFVAAGHHSHFELVWLGE